QGRAQRVRRTSQERQRASLRARSGARRRGELGCRRDRRERVSTSIGFAVIGAGRIGALHARHLAGAVEGARLVMVVDADAATAARVAAGSPGVTVSVDAEAAMEDPEVDAVLIASPTSLHSAQLRSAANAGKAIFCEKPVANDLGETIDAMAEVKRAGVPFQIGFNRRFDPAYAAVG